MLRTYPTLIIDLFTALHFVAIAAFAAMIVSPRLRARFAERCVGHGTALDLAWVRIVACAVLIVYVLTENLASLSYFHPSWYQPPGYLDLLGRAWFDALLRSQPALYGLTAALLLALALGMAGCFTRVALPVAAVLYLVFAALLRSYGKYFHEGYLGFYVLLVLCVLPAGDAWSVDAWRRVRRGIALPDRSEIYRWGVYACFAAACIPYLQLGASKLSFGGLYWFEGDSLRNYMITDDLNLTEYDFDLALRFLDAPVFVYTLSGLLALVLEVAYPFVLVAPRLRRIVPFGVGLLHLGVWFGQDALFTDAILLPLIFLQPSTWRRFRSAAPGAGPRSAP
jgi:hypothetical protein